VSRGHLGRVVHHTSRQGARSSHPSAEMLWVRSLVAAAIVLASTGCAPARHPVAGALAQAPLTTTIEVEVSRTLVRVVFPADTATRWGWFETDDTRWYDGYAWSMWVDGGMDGPRSLYWGVGPDRSAAGAGSRVRRFGSLQALLRAGRGGVCRAGMVQVCDDPIPRVTVADGRVVLALRDSATIARLFGLRPAWVRVYRRTPANSRGMSDAVLVTYVEPQIPEPTIAVLDDAARSRRAYEAGVTRISRRIGGWPSSWPALWALVGDTLRLEVEESTCHHDVCSSSDAVADSGWWAEDTTIVRLEPPTSATQDRAHERVPRVRLVGLRRGRTTLHVHGVRSGADTMPGGEHLPSELTREVVVTPRPARLALHPAADTARPGRPLRIGIEVGDAAGDPIPDAPVEVTADMGSYRRGTVGTVSISVTFERPGSRLVTASLGGLADTVLVTVLDSMPPTGKHGQSGAQRSRRDQDEVWFAFDYSNSVTAYSTLAATGGVRPAPGGLALDARGRLYVANAGRP
jgi:hypothetical protein